LKLIEKEEDMGYWIDVKGHPNLLIKDEVIPKLGESITLVADTLEGQEEDLIFNVNQVMHVLGHGFIKGPPLVILEPVSIK
jgi:hypothetical protein